jgi:hypothetical protein
MKPVVVVKDEIHVNKFGSFAHNDWIGKEYGSKVTKTLLGKRICTHLSRGTHRFFISGVLEERNLCVSPTPHARIVDIDSSTSHADSLHS